MDEQKYWFKRKKIGWGWYPSSVEGWLVTALFIAFIVWWGLLYEQQLEGLQSFEDFVDYVGPMLGALLLLLAICWRTGEPLFDRRDN